MLNLFLTTLLLQSIVTQSNLFAASKGATLDLRVEELQAFIGINVAMGMLRLPQIRDYWATDDIISTPWFPSIISRDSFVEILRYVPTVSGHFTPKKER